MKPAPFAYHAPCTLDEVVGLLSSLDNAKILAGGQSLVPMMNFRVVTPDNLIDVNRVEGLSGIEIAADRLRIGATTRQRDLEFSAGIARACPLIPAGLEHVGHRQTRNRGTIGGSLSHADPSAELPNICSALDARVEIRGRGGARIVPFAEFSIDFMTTAVEADELLVAVEIDLWPEGHGYAFQEFARRRGDFAIVGVAALLDLGPQGQVARAAVSVCGVAAGPMRLPEVEAALLGRIPDDDLIGEVADLACDIEAIEDHHATSGYRRHLARVLTARALVEARAKCRGGRA